MGRHDPIIDARAVGSGSDDPSQRLVRNRANVDHGKVMFSEFGMEIAEGDTGLNGNIVLLRINLENNGG